MTAGARVVLDSNNHRDCDSRYDIPLVYDIVFRQAFFRVHMEDVSPEYACGIPPEMLMAAASELGVATDQVASAVAVLLPDCVSARAYMSWLDNELRIDNARCEVARCLIDRPWDVCMSVLDPQFFVDKYGRGSLQEWDHDFKLCRRPSLKFAQRIFYRQSVFPERPGHPEPRHSDQAAIRPASCVVLRVQQDQPGGAQLISVQTIAWKALEQLRELLESIGADSSVFRDATADMSSSSGWVHFILLAGIRAKAALQRLEEIKAENIQTGWFNCEPTPLSSPGDMHMCKGDWAWLAAMYLQVDVMAARQIPCCTVCCMVTKAKDICSFCGCAICEDCAEAGRHQVEGDMDVRVSECAEITAELVRGTGGFVNAIRF